MKTSAVDSVQVEHPEEEEISPQQEEELLVIETLLGLLEEIEEKKLAGSRQKVRLLELSVRECLETGLGEVLERVFVEHGWDGGRFGVPVTNEIITELLQNLRLVLSEGEEDEEEEEEEEPPNPDIMGNLMGVMKELSAQQHQVNEVTKQLLSVDTELKVFRQETALPPPLPPKEDPTPEELLSILTRYPGRHMTPHLAVLQSDFAKSKALPPSPPVGNHNNNVFTNPREIFSPKEDGLVEKVKKNFKQYACIAVIVGVMNYRNLTKMMEMLSQDLPGAAT